MATKYYGINDKWTDDDIENVIEVASEDGTVNSVKVNGVEYGGGGGGGTATLHFINSANEGVTCLIPIISLADWEKPCISVYDYTPPVDEDLTIPLYNGYCCCYINSNYSLEYSDDILDQGDNYFLVGPAGGTVTMSAGGGGGDN